MHERFREILLNVAADRGANLRLVACFTNPHFGVPSNKSIQVFLPDMHLLSKARREVYSYGLNHEEMLEDVVARLIQMKMDAADDERVIVFHVGDYLDLWRESLNPGDPDVARRIKKDHQELASLLENENLNAHFLLGNHDFDLYQNVTYNNWERRFFIPGDAPNLLILHGDFFDPVEREVPEDLRDIGVYLFSKNRQASTSVLAKMASRAHQYNAQKNFSSAIQLAAPAKLGETLAGDASIEEDLNVQSEGDSVEDGMLFVDEACSECVQANQQPGMNLRTVIIGHTHHARIAVRKMPDGTPFTLIDCGAWIEKCVDADGTNAFPNAQITAISANQARIYQLDLEA